MSTDDKVSLGEILRHRAEPLQTANLAHAVTILIDAFEGLLLVQDVLRRSGYLPRVVTAAFWICALQGEASTVGSGGGVEVFESLDLNPCYGPSEVDDPRILEG